MPQASQWHLGITIRHGASAFSAPAYVPVSHRHFQFRSVLERQVLLINTIGV